MLYTGEAVLRFEECKTSPARILRLHEERYELARSSSSLTGACTATWTMLAAAFPLTCLRGRMLHQAAYLRVLLFGGYHKYFRSCIQDMVPASHWEYTTGLRRVNEGCSSTRGALKLVLPFGSRPLT
jgi:hypothetical protein